MYFRQIPDTGSHALTYLLADEVAGKAVVIDPLCSQATMILSVLAESGLHLECVLRTHVHYPDGCGCGDLCPQTGARFFLGVRNPEAIAGQRVSDGEEIRFGAEVLRVIDTPGHTPGSVCYLWQDRLFTGETLLIQGCGTCSNEVEAGLLYDSVTRRLFALPDETLVFPGYDENGRTVSTIREERTRNLAFAVHSRGEFSALQCSARERERERSPRLVSHRLGWW